MGAESVAVVDHAGNSLVWTLNFYSIDNRKHSPFLPRGVTGSVLYFGRRPLGVVGVRLEEARRVPGVLAAV